jgi:hypothetical protein
MSSIRLLHGLGWLGLLALAAGPPLHAAPIHLPNGRTLEQVDFERHVDSLLGRLGCNSGACHGSFQGKGGLGLSLFGYSPEKDFLALTRDGMGRRINPADPDHSLMLLKPTAQVPHEGGRRFDKGSWQYQVFREWIAQGARRTPGSSTVRRLDVYPREHLFQRPGQAVPLRVVVEFADGTRADMTPFCDFRVKDEAVATVSATGEVRGVQPGDTAIVITYRGQITTARVFVPVAVAADFAYPRLPGVNYVDREVFAKLRRLNIVPSDPAGDTEFLRRVTLDTIGTVPTPAEIRAFLANRDPNKWLRKIDELLAHPLHAALWATKFCDITANNIDVMEDPASLRPQRAQMWHEWFRKRIADNVPYDQIVHGVLCATSRDGLDLRQWIGRESATLAAAEKGEPTGYADRPDLDLFWRRETAAGEFFPLEQMAELTASAFLGVRIECAQCHKHPYDRWTQRDYRAFANVFGQVKLGLSPAGRVAVNEAIEERRRTSRGKADLSTLFVEEVYASNHQVRRLPDPQTGRRLPPKALGGPEIALEGDAREQLFRWMVAPDNPFFARSFVNRVWAWYFGVGLVDPVDNFSVANPPSNARLLDALAQDFIEHGYDIRHLERTVLSSRTYQLSAVPNATNRLDRTNFSHARPRRLSAEVLADVLADALGTGPYTQGNSRRRMRAIEVGANRVQDPDLGQIFTRFGRPERKLACDCERSSEPAVPQSLYLMTDGRLLHKIRGGRLEKLLARTKSDVAVVEELFLATLSRPPDADERAAVLEHVKAKTDRRAAFTDVVWALINTREFILNH